jgi:hypothetical protein
MPLALANRKAADAFGVITGSFTIPANIPAGTKQVVFRGEGGSQGVASYSAQGTHITRVLRENTVIITNLFDPLAQTFTLDTPRILGAVDLKFTNRGLGRKVATSAAVATAGSNVISVTTPTGILPGLLAFTPDGTSFGSVVSINGASLTMSAPAPYSFSGTILSFNDDAPVFVQIRETTAGVPNLTIHGEAIINPVDMIVNPLGNPVVTTRATGRVSEPCITVDSTAGIVPGMRVQGPGMYGPGWYGYAAPYVTAVYGDNVFLSWVNGAQISGVYTFSLQPYVVGTSGQRTLTLTNPAGVSIPAGWGVPTTYTPSVAGIKPGMTISHAAIPAGTTIVSISGLTLTLSNAITANITNAEGQFVTIGQGTPLANQYTRATFPLPICLEANREYAIVLLSDDPDHAVGIATLGQYVLPGNGNLGWVTSQAYTVGTLMVSSNAATWSPLPKSDLAFRLMGCRFTSTSQLVDFGDVPAQGVTDLLPMGNVERPSDGTDVQFVITEKSINLDHASPEGQPITLDTPITDTLRFKALLTGTPTMSPILYQNSQLFTGVQDSSANYITNAIDADLSFGCTIIMEVLRPGSATVVPQIQNQLTNQDGTDSIVNNVYQTEWKSLDLIQRTDSGDGWFEETYHVSGLRGVGLDRTTCCQILLGGSAKDRPQVANLRVITHANS